MMEELRKLKKVTQSCPAACRLNCPLPSFLPVILLTQLFQTVTVLKWQPPHTQGHSLFRITLSAQA